MNKRVFFSDFSWKQCLKLFLKDVHVDSKVKGQLFDEIIIVAETLVTTCLTIAWNVTGSTGPLATNIKISRAQSVPTSNKAKPTQYGVICTRWQRHRYRFYHSLNLLSLKVLTEWLLTRYASGVGVISAQIVHVFPVRGHVQ